MTITSAEQLLQKIQSLFFFAGAIAGVFQNIFFFSLGDFRAVVTYDLISLIVLFGVYLVSGSLLNKYSSRTLMRTGLTFFVIVNSLFFLLRERSINYLIPLAIIAGLGHGSFWSGSNLSQYILTHESTRHHYFGRLNFLINFALAIGPLMGGGFIQLMGLFSNKIGGYAFLFLCVAVIDLYLVFLTGKLPRHSGIRFTLAHLFKTTNTRWILVLTQQFLFGLIDVAFAVISSILFFLIVKSEFGVGTVKFMSTLIYAVASIVAGMLLQKNSQAYISTTIVASTGLFIFGLLQNWWGLLSLIIIVNIFSPFLNIVTAKNIYDTIDLDKRHWQDKYHYLVERDTVLGLGRILNYIFLLSLFTPQNQLQITKTWVLIIPVLPLLIGLFQYLSIKTAAVRSEI